MARPRLPLLRAAAKWPRSRHHRIPQNSAAPFHPNATGKQSMINAVLTMLNS
jgi:hypothetical protein